MDSTIDNDKSTRFLEVGIWLLFFALLIPAGAVGYAIGHGTKSSSSQSSVTAPGSLASSAGK